MGTISHFVSGAWALLAERGTALDGTLLRVQVVSSPKVASLGDRVVAFVVDVAACCALSVLIALAFGLISLLIGLAFYPRVYWDAHIFFATLGALAGVVGLPLWFHLYSGLMTRTKWQATLGMRVMGLRLVRDDGAPLKFGLGAAHSALGFLSSLPLGIGALTAAVSEDGRAWYDRTVKLQVVRDRRYWMGGRESPATNNIHITNSNGVVVTIGEVVRDLHVQLNHRIARSSQAADVADLVKEMSKAIEHVANEASDDVREHVQSMLDNLDAVSKQVDKAKPDRRWYELSLFRIVEAAEAVGSLATPILATVDKLRPLLLP